MGEQVLLLSIGGKLDTAFVLPGIYLDDNPAPSASADALHISFLGGAVLLVLVKVDTCITLDMPEVVCTNKLAMGSLEVQKGGTIHGTMEHSGGALFQRCAD